MNEVFDINVGDDGITIQGTVYQAGFKTITDLVGWSVKFSLIKIPGGTAVVNKVDAQLSNLDPVKGTVSVSISLAGLVIPVGRYKIRWTFITPLSKVISSPHPFNKQTILRVNA